VDEVPVDAAGERHGRDGKISPARRAPYAAVECVPASGHAGSGGSYAEVGDFLCVCLDFHGDPNGMYES